VQITPENQTALEKFVEHKYGLSYLDEEGYVWGQKKRGSTTFRSEGCTGNARSTQAKRCSDCQRLFVACSNAKSRHTASQQSGTQKFIPIASLKVSEHVKDLLEQYKKENKGTTPKHVAREDDLAIDVSPLKFEIWKYCVLILFPPEPRRQ